MRKSNLQPEPRELVFNANGFAGAVSRFAPVVGTSLLADPVKGKGRARQALQLPETQANCLRTPRKKELPPLAHPHSAESPTKPGYVLIGQHARFYLEFYLSW